MRCCARYAWQSARPSEPMEGQARKHLRDMLMHEMTWGQRPCSEALAAELAPALSTAAFTDQVGGWRGAVVLMTERLAAWRPIAGGGAGSCWRTRRRPLLSVVPVCRFSLGAPPTTLLPPLVAATSQAECRLRCCRPPRCCRFLLPPTTLLPPFVAATSLCRACCHQSSGVLTTSPRPKRSERRLRCCSPPRCCRLLSFPATLLPPFVAAASLCRVCCHQSSGAPTTSPDRRRFAPRDGAIGDLLVPAEDLVRGILLVLRFFGLWRRGQRRLAAPSRGGVDRRHGRSRGHSSFARGRARQRRARLVGHERPLRPPSAA